MSINDDIAAAADILSRRGFSANMPENDLHPDPARLQQELILLRHRVEALEAVVSQLAGIAPYVGKFPI